MVNHRLLGASYLVAWLRCVYADCLFSFEMIKFDYGTINH